MNIDKGDGGPLAIRRFSEAKLQDAVERVLGKLPSDKRVAAVAVVDLDGAKLAFLAKIGNGWSVMGVGERSWTGTMAARAELRWSM